MKGITIKLPELTLQRLRAEARAAGRSIADIVRERLEGTAAHDQTTVYAQTSDLAGSLSGSRKVASNERRKFRRS